MLHQQFAHGGMFASGMVVDDGMDLRRAAARDDRQKSMADFATTLTLVEVDRDDPAFQKPDKPIGPAYSEAEARKLAAERGWTVAPDGDKYRRIIASPMPKRIFELRPIKWLIEHGTIVICAGGGGIPTVYDESHKLYGVEAVIDKDRASALLASEIGAQAFLMLTDVDGVYENWGTAARALITRLTPDDTRTHAFPAGSMGPKVEAAAAFVNNGVGRLAGIGRLADAAAILEGAAGTIMVRNTENAAEVILP